jgi:RNA polymerase sigma-70 factor, ECF subfamily
MFQRNCDARPVEPVACAPAPSDPAWDWAGLSRSATLEARRLLRDPYDAEDAAQEAMVRAWRQRSSCRSPEAPEGWLRQIARNEALRNHGRAREHEVLPADQPAAVDDPLERIYLDDLLGKLRGQDRLLVTMRYKLDLPDVEIAERLGIAQSTVRVRLHRLKKELRVLMSELR